MIDLGSAAAILGIAGGVLVVLSRTPPAWATIVSTAGGIKRFILRDIYHRLQRHDEELDELERRRNQADERQ